MMRCGLCGREYPAGARFCGDDGTPLLDVAGVITGVANAPHFESLARAARLNAASRPTMDALWGAVYSLPSWLFHVRGDNMIPITCPIEGRVSVMAFTDHPAAQRFRQLQEYTPDDDISVMLLDIESASETLLGLRARGVEVLLFNHGGEGFSLPLNNLPGVYHYFNGRELPCVERAGFMAGLDRSVADIEEYERGRSID